MTAGDDCAVDGAAALDGAAPGALDGVAIAGVTLGAVCNAGGNSNLLT